MIIIIADVDEVAALLDMDEPREPEIILPQTSGPCVHYDEQTEYAADTDPCTYPYGDGCPHLDNPDVLCPVKDACYAMRDVARMQETCEAEQTEQDTDMTAEEAVYETTAPEWVEPAPDDGALRTYTVPAPRKPHPNAWSDEEDDVIRRAQSAAEAGRLYSETYGIWKRTQGAVTSRWYRLQAAGKLIAPDPEEPVYETAEPEFVEPEPDGDHAYAIQLPTPAKRKDAWTEDENWTVARADTRAEAIEIYRAAYPDSTRTDKAIRSRWEKLHRDCKEPLAPDFVGDAVPVTQCDEEAFAVPRPTFRPGDRVRIKHALHRGQTGEIQRYFPATENYLVAIDGMPDRIILRDKDLEVEA